MEELIQKTLTIEPKDCEFHNFHQKKTPADYKEAESEFVGYYKRLKGVAAIYRYGNISIPGISDLDFVVVLRDSYKHRFGARYDIEYFSKETQYLLNHAQNFLSRSLMKEVHLYHGLSNLKKLWGEDISLTHYDKTHVQGVGLLDYTDFLVFVIPKVLLKFLLEKRINVRMSISKLKAIKFYTAALHDLTGSENEKFNHFNAEVEDLRRSWLDNVQSDNLHRLLFLMKKGIAVAYHLIEKYHAYLKSHPEIWHTPEKLVDERVGLKTWQDITYFENSWEAAKSFQETVEHYLKEKKYLQTLPLNFSYHLLYYSTCDGRFGSLVRKNLFLMPHINFKISNTVGSQKAEFINRQIDFIERSKITDSLSFNLHHFGYKFFCQRRRGEYRYSHIQRSLRGHLKGVRSYLKKRKNP